MLFDIVSADPERAGHGWEGYYFAENGHTSWYDIAHAIGKVLAELRVAPKPGPTTFTPVELVRYWGSDVRLLLYPTPAFLSADRSPQILGNYWGTTCRCRADRGRALGWAPKYISADMLGERMKAEVEAQLEAVKKNGGVVDFSYEKSLAQIVGAPQ